MAQPQEENSALTGAALGTTTMKLGGDWFLWTMFYLPLISSKEQRGDLMSGFSYSCVDGISHCGTTEAGEPPESSRPVLREGNNPILGDCSARSSQWVWDFIRFITGVLPSSAPKISHGRFLLVLMDRNPLLLGINAFLLYFYIILYILVSAEIRESWNGLGWERLLKARFFFFFVLKWDTKVFLVNPQCEDTSPAVENSLIKHSWCGFGARKGNIDYSQHQPLQGFFSKMLGLIIPSRKIFALLKTSACSWDCSYQEKP